MNKTLSKLAKKISKNEFMSIFKDGMITQKDGTELQVGITFQQFMKHEKITLDRTMYTDFMLDDRTNTWYKLPYYLNDDKQICYLDFEIKLYSNKDEQNTPFSSWSRMNYNEEDETSHYEERNVRRQLFKEGVDDYVLEEGEIIRLAEEERVWVPPFADVTSDELLW